MDTEKQFGWNWNVAGVLYLGAMLLIGFATGCTDDATGKNAIPVQIVEQEPQGIKVTAFLKLPVDTDLLSGLPVYVYDVQADKRFKELKQKASDSRLQLNLLEGELADISRQLTECRRNVADRNQILNQERRWREITERCRNTKEKFQEMGYNSFTAYDPKSGQNIQFKYERGKWKWENWKEGVAGELTEFHSYAVAQTEALKAQANSLNLVIDQMNEEGLKKRLSSVNYQISKAQEGNRELPEIVQVIEKIIPPAEAGVTDETGKASFELPVGNYYIGATYRFTVIDEEIGWWYPVEVKESEQASVILTQSTSLDPPQ